LLLLLLRLRRLRRPLLGVAVVAPLLPSRHCPRIDAKGRGNV
jgi:hypothetical protein